MDQCGSSLFMFVVIGASGLVRRRFVADGFFLHVHIVAEGDDVPHMLEMGFGRIRPGIQEFVVRVYVVAVQQGISKEK